MHKRGLGLVALVSLLVVLSAAGSAGAAPGGEPGKPDGDVGFWTHARVAKAVARDYTYDPAKGRFVPGERTKPGGGGGSGGGGGGGGGTPSTSTTGSSWPAGTDKLVRKTTGKVLFEMAGVYYVCSASTVAAAGDEADGKSIVVTAGHCVYDNESATKGYATHWVYIPDYDDGPAPLSSSSESYCKDTPYGCWHAVELYAAADFRAADGFSGLAPANDFGVARLALGGKGGSVNPDAEQAVGAQGIDFGVLDNRTQVSAFGYPAAGKYRGSDLVYCAGTTGTDASTGSYSLGCDMTGGSSGGPWLSAFNGSTGVGKLSSVNSYGYSGVKNMYGPRFNAATSALYGAANG